MDKRRRRRAQRPRRRAPAEVLGSMLAVARRREVTPLIQALEALLTRWETGK